MRAWAICDRCSFKYYSTQMALESTGFLVCRRCDDGAYDLKRHPQNRPFRPKPELREVRNATTDDDFSDFVVDPWTPDMSRRR